MKSDSYSRFIRSSAYQELLQAKKKVMAPSPKVHCIWSPCVPSHGTRGLFTRAWRSARISSTEALSGLMPLTPCTLESGPSSWTHSRAHATMCYTTNYALHMCHSLGRRVCLNVASFVGPNLVLSICLHSIHLSVLNMGDSSQCLIYGSGWGREFGGWVGGWGEQEHRPFMK